MSKKNQKKISKASTVNEKEIRQFDILGQKWWDESGPMKPLHRINPTRLQYIRDSICNHYQVPTLKNLAIIDIGCGGGLVTEPLCRMGGAVTGLDAGVENIKVATAHALTQKLDIHYICSSVEAFVKQGKKFDVVTALEIIEHVDEPQLFIEACCKLLKPNGIIIFSTLNRTAKSFLSGIIAAEYILRWLPAGTHDWKKFMRPSDIAKYLPNNMALHDICGLTYSPFTKTFRLNKKDTSVNYFLIAVKK